MKIPVCFVIDPVEVTAVFLSRETHPTSDERYRVCYSRIGQHSECTFKWMQDRTRQATIEEYEPLLMELASIYNVDGDELDVQPRPTNAYQRAITGEDPRARDKLIAGLKRTQQ